MHSVFWCENLLYGRLSRKLLDNWARIIATWQLCEGQGVTIALSQTGYWRSSHGDNYRAQELPVRNLGHLLMTNGRNRRFVLRSMSVSSQRDKPRAVFAESGERHFALKKVDFSLQDLSRPVSAPVRKLWGLKQAKYNRLDASKFTTGASLAKGRGIQFTSFKSTCWRHGAF